MKQAQRITALSQDGRVVRLFHCFNRCAHPSGKRDLGTVSAAFGACQQSPITKSLGVQVWVGPDLV